jgi:flagellar biogenesis protein FliO
MARLIPIWSRAAAGLMPVAAAAAETANSGTEKLREFGLADSGAGSLPLGRVLFAFVLVAALAFCATWLLRRYGFRLPASMAGGAAAIRVIARSSLPGGVTCQLIEVQGKQVLVTATRSGVTTIVLGDVPHAVPDVAPAGPAA